MSITYDINHLITRICIIGDYLCVTCTNEPQLVNDTLLRLLSSSKDGGDTNFSDIVDKEFYLVRSDKTPESEGMRLGFNRSLAAWCGWVSDVVDCSTHQHTSMQSYQHIIKQCSIAIIIGFPSHIVTPTTLRYALTHYCDITIAPSKKLLRMLAEYLLALSAGVFELVGLFVLSPSS